MAFEKYIDTSSSGITAIIYVAIIAFIYVPLSLYHGYKYYKQRNHMIMRKRYSSIMIYEIIIIIIKMCIDGVRDALKLYLSSSSYILICIQLFAGLFYKIMVCIWLWRFWLLQFDLNWTNIILKQEWKSVINKHINNNNFYLLNKKTFGNKRWIFKIFILPLIIFTYLSTDILRFLLSDIYYIDSNTVNLVKLCCSPISIGPAILLTIIYFKIPRFKDHFFIKNELGLLLISILMMYISYWSYYFFIQFGADIIAKNKYDEIIRYFHPTSTFAVVFFDFLCLMICTFWVNKKVKNIIINQSYSIHKKYDNEIKGKKSENSRGNVDERDVPLIQIKLISASDDEIEYDDENDKYLTLQSILRNDDGTDLFMEHLQYEISTENLLCFIEFIQFQKYVLINNNNDSKTERQLICERIIFSNSTPNSFIVFDLNDDINVKTKKLYKKYIAENGEYPVNIPCRERLKFNQWINHDLNDNGDLLLVLDSSLEEIWDLLNQSFYRFQRTAAYKTLCHQIFNQ